MRYKNSKKDFAPLEQDLMSSIPRVTSEKARGHRLQTAGVPPSTIQQTNIPITRVIVYFPALKPK